MASTKRIVAFEDLEMPLQERIREQEALVKELLTKLEEFQATQQKESGEQKEKTAEDMEQVRDLIENNRQNQEGKIDFCIRRMEDIDEILQGER